MAGAHSDDLLPQGVDRFVLLLNHGGEDGHGDDRGAEQREENGDERVGAPLGAASSRDHR